ncbi:hypothetical protein KIM372_08250 [Bombiscardovia nodaiensis]|uniref:Uncharacterized protein n=1 Tax=Bombiscardovia nodaiensis TaxID=2932181 RepID=A0ABM8B7Z0_9BIFI|nr:hypothetical protein KIM372_08250 [Bombiscardovia nodaiensis]
MTNTETLNLVCTLQEPYKDAEITQISSAYDGRLVVLWRDSKGEQEECRVYEKSGDYQSMSFSAFPGPVDYVVPMPKNRWLGCVCRVPYEDGKPLPDGAWIISDRGQVLSTSNMGKALLCPVVAQDGTIWAPYWDEYEWRDDRVVDEESDYGKYTAGCTGMTVFDDHLKVIGRHDSPTFALEIYASHHDGRTFWYLSYGEWVIDSWGPKGQGQPMPANDDLQLVGAPFLIYKDRLARLGNIARDYERNRKPEGYVSLYRYPPSDNPATPTKVNIEDIRQTVLVYPDMRPVSMDDFISSWGNKFYLVDHSQHWYELEAFPDC